jgi:hypothetical protein
VIVEIGDKPFIASAFPDETVYFSTLAPADGGRAARTLPSLGALWRWLDDPQVTLIVVHPTFYAPWSWRWLNRAIFSRRALQGRLPLLRAFAPQLLRWRGRAPIVVLDHEDLPVINRNNLFLLDRCRLYFKRELPVDRWRIFLKTAHPNLPSAKFRHKRRNLGRIAKLRPLSIGLPLGPKPPAVEADPEKRADIFFAGRVEGSSSLRGQGLAELAVLRAQGVTVDIPDGPLPRDAFYQRCAAAWLVWSPEGYGWDCFRHYEALACGSVPMINVPSIERYAPLAAGEHALYYEVEPGGLTRAILRALADKPALKGIAERGRQFVLAHHTPSAIARYVVETAKATGDEDG